MRLDDPRELTVLVDSAGVGTPGAAEPDRSRLDAHARLGDDSGVVDDIPPGIIRLASRGGNVTTGGAVVSNVALLEPKVYVAPSVDEVNGAFDVRVLENGSSLLAIHGILPAGESAAVVGSLVAQGGERMRWTDITRGVLHAEVVEGDVGRVDTESAGLLVAAGLRRGEAVGEDDLVLVVVLIVGSVAVDNDLALVARSNEGLAVVGAGLNEDCGGGRRRLADRVDSGLELSFLSSF